MHSQMRFTLIAPMHNEAKYMSLWIDNVEKLDPDEVLIGLDRCTDLTEKLLRPHGFKTVKYGDIPNGFKMRGAGIRRDLYSRSSNDVIVNTSADLLLDPKIKKYVKQIGKYGLISFGYFDYPWNIQSFERYLISQYSSLHGFAGLLALSREAWLQTENIEEVKQLLRAEDTHLHMAIKKHYQTKHINTRSWHLRPNEDKMDHYYRGQAQYTLETRSLWKSFLHSVVMLRPAAFAGYIHARRGIIR